MHQPHSYPPRRVGEGALRRGGDGGHSHGRAKPRLRTRARTARGCLQVSFDRGDLEMGGESHLSDRPHRIGDGQRHSHKGGRKHATAHAPRSGQPIERTLAQSSGAVASAHFGRGRARGPDNLVVEIADMAHPPTGPAEPLTVQRKTALSSTAWMTTGRRTKGVSGTAVRENPSRGRSQSSLYNDHRPLAALQVKTTRLNAEQRPC